MSQFVLVVASRAITEFMLAVLAIFFTPPARASDRSGFRAEMFRKIAFRVGVFVFFVVACYGASGRNK